MHHHLEVTIPPLNRRTGRAEVHTRRINKRLWEKLFGRQQVVILFPGDTVDTVTITEQPQRGETPSQRASC